MRKKKEAGAGAFEKHLVRADALHSHERTRAARAAAVKHSISRCGAVRAPLVVDAASFVVLDGHHRLRALRELGARLAPVRFVDYESRAVRVKPRRRGVRVSKRLVVQRALEGKAFPSKTTRHEHPLERAPPAATPLEDLK